MWCRIGSTAESVLNACISRVEQCERCLLLDHKLTAVERILVVHDEHPAPIRQHRYLDVWKRLQRYIMAGKRSPIAAAADT
ncbi:hypothetical protein [Burkholderia cenocepacia]|uniref:hypothetical protein n=1 Tax=Burkholderia cenocepacia TaxID=95486 RepID=UPI002B254067|nr:hypothetical protein [Burkholderia cenocepacia]MEB2541713.1 hypothetical protein [Burkholderia cenocepacia]